MRRTAILIMSLLVASLVLFLLLRLLPGDPAAALLSVGADQAQIEAARAQVGSDLPIAKQFASFLADMFRLDLGTSFVNNASVLDEIGARLTVTIPLALIGFMLSMMIAVPLGIISGVNTDRWYAQVISVISQVGLAVPAFWMGILLVLVFSIKLGWLPSGGYPASGWDKPGSVLTSLVLPAITIALIIAASQLRYVRSATLDVLGSDYMRTARAMGASFPEAFMRHGLPNGSIPVISILGIELSTAFLGAVVIERVFTLPGLGSMLLTAIEQRDYPNIQGVLMISTLLVLIVGFLADVLQRIIDPRLRQSKGLMQ
ncbi:ABC transporter permease [Sulfitobacter sp. F26204]|uniref:ABC transporter permease n=1 Tax=Sulfitobacter sp. F26204 TaxID=2996014 RepID=UPI00225DF6EF|nr:ABC transporter permease [Sulfitobacter sp. F26204]MCX7560501.1 ABC transporter permease [Sulfitobacter sp. F26204]